MGDRAPPETWEEVHCQLLSDSQSQEPLSLEEGLWVISMYVFVSLPICQFCCVYYFSFFYA